MSDSKAKSWTSQLPDRVVTALREAQDDVVILLGHLIEANDGRLQSHFDDTRPQLSVPVARIAAPPCKTYEEFLTRLTAIELALGDPHASEPQVPPCDGKPGLGNIPFLNWSRDFLASVAAPATADSIAISRLYVDVRSSFNMLRGLGGMIRRTFAGGDDRNGARAAQRKRIARWMAGMLRWRERGAFVLTIGVILLSTYSISGHIILQARQTVIEEGKDIGQRIESLEKDLSVPASVPVAAASATSASGTTGGTATAVAKSAEVRITPLCDQIFPDAGGAAGESAQNSRFHYHYVSVAQINLCAERQRNLNQGIAIAAQMLSWLHAIDILHTLHVFGDDAKVADKLAGNERLCDMVSHQPSPAPSAAPSAAPFNASSPAMSGGAPAGQARCAEFADILEYYGRVPEAVLQCLTLYILPSLYGALGAILATIRYVRGRVSASLLTYIDRGRISQDWVLGLVLGAVIGLFSDYIGKANPVQGITLAAIALLAGYNVSAVFGLFENVSNRLFAASDTNNRSDSGKPAS